MSTIVHRPLASHYATTCVLPSLSISHDKVSEFHALVAASKDTVGDKEEDAQLPHVVLSVVYEGITEPGSKSPIRVDHLSRAEKRQYHLGKLMELMKLHPGKPSLVIDALHLIQTDMDKREFCQLVSSLALKHPDDRLLMLMALRAAKEIGDLETCTQLVALPNIEPRHLPALFLQIATKAYQGAFSSAIKDLDQLIDRFPTDCRPRLERAKLQHTFGDTRTAWSTIEESMEVVKGTNYHQLYSLFMDLAPTRNASLARVRFLAKHFEKVSSSETHWKIILRLAIHEMRIQAMHGGVHRIIQVEGKPVIEAARANFQKAFEICPKLRKWVVLIYWANLEGTIGRQEAMRDLYRRAQVCASDKCKPEVLLVWARAEQYMNCHRSAETRLRELCTRYPQSWKGWSELTSFYLYHNCIKQARQVATRALSYHADKGRILAAYATAHLEKSNEVQIKNLLEQGMAKIPKSGELLCELGRLYANPLSSFYDPVKAQEYFSRAISYTPQYGDSIVELVRLRFLEGRADPDFTDIRMTCLKANPIFGFLWTVCKTLPSESTAQVFHRIIERVRQSLSLRFCRPSTYIEQSTALNISERTYHVYNNPPRGNSRCLSSDLRWMLFMDCDGALI